MPYIQVDMWEGRSRDQKAELVRELTDSMHRICGSPAEHVTVVIREHGRDNWADAGHLSSSSDYPFGSPTS